MKMKRTYAVVENAGYEGERVVNEGFKNVWEAYKWIDHKYAVAEVETLHVLVRVNYADGTMDYCV